MHLIVLYIKHSWLWIFKTRPTIVFFSVFKYVLSNMVRQQNSPIKLYICNYVVQHSKPYTEHIRPEHCSGKKIGNRILRNFSSKRFQLTDGTSDCLRGAAVLLLVILQYFSTRKKVYYWS